MLEHGGRLRRAAEQYGIPLSDWLDLSTGINPNGWPVPALPASCWQRLPEEDDALLLAARRYYQNESLLAVAGSQAAIQTLPFLRPKSRVGVLHPAYAEHAAGWRKVGHDVTVAEANAIGEHLIDLDVVILINPNNPTGQSWQTQQLLTWQEQLAARGGWLIVDEAFVDGLPESSLAATPVRPGLIVLRSIGKFFGLAGIRCGFVIAESHLLAQLTERLGPWTISHPARFVATQALLDTVWQVETAAALADQGRRLAQLLAANGWPPSGGCHLFQWIKSDAAEKLHVLLAEQGILTRFFNDPASLRFGLPKSEADWERLSRALQNPGIKALLNQG